MTSPELWGHLPIFVHRNGGQISGTLTGVSSRGPTSGLAGGRAGHLATTPVHIDHTRFGVKKSGKTPGNFRGQEEFKHARRANEREVPTFQNDPGGKIDET